MSSETTIFSMIDRLRVAPPRSASDLSTILGVTLQPVSRKSGIAEGRGVSASGVAFSSVEFRSSSTAGEIIIIELDEADVVRLVVLARYAPLDVTDVPRGRSIYEETYYSRREPWGTLSFGFAEHHRERLNSIVLKIDASGQ